MINFLKHNFLTSKLMSIISLLRHNSFLVKSGWFKSYLFNLPFDINKNPLPWFTYSAISYLEKKLNKEMIILEFGCGNSTLWWANKVKTVVSVEHDYTWYQLIKNKIPSNVTLYHKSLENKDYSSAINSINEKFDLVIIDGRDRLECLKNSLVSLKQNGIIILDNSDRKEYEEIFTLLFSHNFKEITFTGMGPITPWAWGTTIFYKPDNVFNI